jgi:ribosomal protein L3 glutamine methyltransferase
MTLGQSLTQVCEQLSQADLFYGHGFVDAEHEAMVIVAVVTGADVSELTPDNPRILSSVETDNIAHIVKRRTVNHEPLPYIIEEAWQGEFAFFVDARVLIPRSYIAALLLGGLDPWIQDESAPLNLLEIGTGSGALSIIAAHVYPNATITATDISPNALAVAAINREDYALESRIKLVQADVYEGLTTQTFDMIFSNPPYVTQAAMDDLPAEYRHEPSLALAAGELGLTIVDRLLKGAPALLKPEGFILIEVGHNRAIVEEAYPQLDMIWLSTDEHGDAMFLVTRDALQALT